MKTNGTNVPTLLAGEPTTGYPTFIQSGDTNNQAAQVTAIDNAGNVWAQLGPNNNNGVVKLSNAGALLSGPTPYGNGYFSTSLALDGAGNAFVGDNLGGGWALDEVTNAGAVVAAPATGLGHQYLVNNFVSWLAVDGTGSVWCTTGRSTNGLFQFIGLGTPVVTPVVSNLLAPYAKPASLP